MTESSTLEEKRDDSIVHNNLEWKYNEFSGFERDLGLVFF